MYFFYNLIEHHIIDPNADSLIWTNYLIWTIYMLNIHISVDWSNIALVCLIPHKLNAIVFNC